MVTNTTPYRSKCGPGVRSQASCALCDQACTRGQHRSATLDVRQQLVQRRPLKIRRGSRRPHDLGISIQPLCCGLATYDEHIALALERSDLLRDRRLSALARIDRATLVLPHRFNVLHHRLPRPVGPESVTDPRGSDLERKMSAEGKKRTSPHACKNHRGRARYGWSP